MKKKIVIFFFVFSALFGLGLYIFHWEFRKPVLDIYFFHLDRGRSIFIRTAHGKTILIDGGQNSQVLRELTKVFPFYRRRIDEIILTNSAPKNSGGLVEVINRFDVGKIIEPEFLGTSTALTALEGIIKKKDLKVERVKKGDNFVMDNLNFKVLFPDSDFKFNKSSLPELVLTLSCDHMNMLLLGDASKTIQKSFISEVGKMNLLEYANSAGDGAVSADLFEKTNPDFIVITKKETDRVSSSKTKKKFDIEKIDQNSVVNLEEKGTAHFISDGVRFWLD